jgi:hypothetical protein
MRTITTFCAILVSSAAFAAPQNANTPADTIHPNIHDKVGQGAGGNANANPNGNSGNGSNGGQIHGIGNVPGQNGDNPNGDGVKGQANELETMHGGIGAYNKNAN